MNDRTLNWRAIRFLVGMGVAVISIALRGTSGSPTPTTVPQFLFDDLVAAYEGEEEDPDGPTVTDFSLTLSELDTTAHPTFAPAALTEFVADKPVVSYRGDDAWEPATTAVWPPGFIQFENTSDEAIVIEFAGEELTPLRVPAHGSSSIDFGRVPPSSYTFQVRGGAGQGTIDTRSSSRPRPDAMELQTVTVGSGRISLELPDDPAWDITTSFNGLIMKPADDPDPNGSFQRYLAAGETPWSSGLSIFFDPSGFSTGTRESIARSALDQISIPGCPAFTTGQVRIGAFAGREEKHECKPVNATFMTLLTDDMDGIIYVTAAGLTKSERDRLIGYLDTLQFSNEIILNDLVTPAASIGHEPLSGNGKVAQLELAEGQFGEYSLHEGIGWDSPVMVSQFSGEPVDVYINTFNSARLVAGYALTIPFDWVLMPRAFIEVRTNPFLRSWVVIENGDFEDIPTEWYSSTAVPESIERTYTTDIGGTEVSVTLAAPDGWAGKDGSTRYRNESADDPAVHAWYVGTGETPRIDQWALWTWQQPEYLSLDIDSSYAWTVARFISFDGLALTVAQTYADDTMVSVEISSAREDHDTLVARALIPSLESLRIER